ncbi:single hybrid motif-containing protein [Haematococcus lacustris]
MYEFRWPLPQWSRVMAEGQGGRASQGSALARPGAVLAPLPGRIVKLLVKEGEQVMRGAGLAVVEAMKMEHLVVAERAGRVQGLGVEPGSQVADGQELMRLVAAQ